MFLIDTVLVDEDIATTPFLCDLNVCKGACCTMEGESGAPLLDEEVETLDQIPVEALDYLPEDHKRVLLEYGPVQGSAGSYTTRCIDNKDCVFVYRDNGTAKCSIERAFIDGKSAFRKPLSCHLFPIRITDFGGPYLYYENIPECKPALAQGAQQGVRISDMAKDALIRLYGAEWYAQFKIKADKRAAKEKERARELHLDKDNDRR